MADEEMVESSADQEQSGGGGPMITMKGWIIVLTLVIGEAVFFFLILYAGGTDKAKSTDIVGAHEVMPADKVGSYRVTLNDLNYSIMTTTQMATLSMKIDIILGRTEEELADPDGAMPEDTVMQEYVEAVRALEPYIRDELQTIVDNMTYQQLRKTEGKQIIRSKIKAYVNDRLKNLTFKSEDKDRGSDRVTRITISQFILQQ